MKRAAIVDPIIEITKWAVNEYNKGVSFYIPYSLFLFQNNFELCNFYKVHIINYISILHLFALFLTFVFLTLACVVCPMFSLRIDGFEYLYYIILKQNQYEKIITLSENFAPYSFLLGDQIFLKKNILL